MGKVLKNGGTMETPHLIQRTVRVATLLAAAVALSSCGSSIKARNGSSDLTSTSSEGKAGTECNSFDAGAVRLSGKVTTYYYNGVMQEDRVRIRFTSMSEKFDQSSNVHMQMFRWKAFSDGSTQVDSTPLNMIVEKGTVGAYPISGVMTSFNLLNLTKLRAQGGVGGTTTQSFFDDTVFVVIGLDYDWQALKIVLYDGATVIGQADVLLPVFMVNPNTYGKSHPDVLNQLHPFWTTRTSGATDADWASRAKSYCF